MMKARIDFMNVDPGIRQAMLGLEQQVSKGGLNINLEWTEALTLVADTHVPDEPGIVADQRLEPPQYRRAHRARRLRAPQP